MAAIPPRKRMPRVLFLSFRVFSIIDTGLEFTKCMYNVYVLAGSVEMEQPLQLQGKIKLKPVLLGLFKNVEGGRVGSSKSSTFFFRGSDTGVSTTFFENPNNIG